MSKNICAIRIGTYTFAQGDGVLLEARCQRTRKKGGSSLTITLADPRLELAQALPLPSSNARVPVVAVWGPPRRQRRIFAGLLSTMTVSLPGRIEISAIDSTRRVRHVERARVRGAVDLADLAQDVATQIGATVDAPAELVRQIGQFSAVVQHGESDWELLARLASSAGVDVWLEDLAPDLAGESLPVLYLRAAGEVDAALPPVRLTAGDNLLQWSCEIEAKTRRTTSNVVNLKGSPVLASGDEDAQARAIQLMNTGLVLASEDAPSYADDTVRQALLAGARQRRVFVATATLAPARPDLTPRGGVFAEGLGARFNGPWVVETIRDDLLHDRQQITIYSDGAA